MLVLFCFTFSPQILILLSFDYKQQGENRLQLSYFAWKSHKISKFRTYKFCFPTNSRTQSSQVLCHLIKKNSFFSPVLNDMYLISFRDLARNTINFCLSTNSLFKAVWDISIMSPQTLPLSSPNSASTLISIYK